MSTLFEIAETAGFPLVNVVGDVDISNYGSFETVLEKVSKVADRGFVVSFLDCKYIDSTAITSLIQAQNSPLRKGKIVLVVPRRDQLMRAFEIANLPKTLAFAESLEAAVAMMNDGT